MVTGQAGKPGELALRLVTMAPKQETEHVRILHQIMAGMTAPDQQMKRAYVKLEHRVQVRSFMSQLPYHFSYTREFLLQTIPNT